MNDFMGGKDVINLTLFFFIIADILMGLVILFKPFSRTTLNLIMYTLLLVVTAIEYYRNGIYAQGVVIE